MSIFANIERVTVNVRTPKGEQGITLLVRDDLSVEQAVAYQIRSEQHEGDNFEQGIALLLAYVEGWEVDGADSEVPWSEDTLRRVTMTVFESLVVAVSDKVAPETPETEDSEDDSPNA
jgi:hypothetical protein